MLTNRTLSRAIRSGQLTFLLSILAAIFLTPTISNAEPSVVEGDSSQQLCFRHTDYMNPNKREAIPCDIVQANSDSFVKGVKNVATTSATSGASKFDLQFTCIPSTAAVCGKAQQAFQLAFTILEGTLLLNAPIIVNATFLDFCTTMGQCGSDGFQILGGAAPERSHILKDDDGVMRAYPQALVKQLRLAQHPAYSAHDIFAQFNAAANFHFPTDADPIKSGQSDFLFVILHEMVHGLGFTSAWDDYINNTPSLLTPGISGATDASGQFVFNGFVENAFDRFMIDTSTNQPMSSRTAALNQIVASGSRTFRSVAAFTAALTASSQYKSVGSQVFSLATTAGSLAFKPTSGGKNMLLETSLNPYAEGSSVSHADVNAFSNTADYLMRFRVDPGVSLDQATKIGNGGPIGPVLTAVLSSLGYATQLNPNPLNNARVETSAGYRSRAEQRSAWVPAILAGIAALLARRSICD